MTIILILWRFNSTSALRYLALRELRTLRICTRAFSPRVAGGVQVYSVAGGVQVYSITNYSTCNYPKNANSAPIYRYRS